MPQNTEPSGTADTTPCPTCGRLRAVCAVLGCDRPLLLGFPRRWDSSPCWARGR